jgi:DNA-binding MarR family transcriptional regulator
VPEEDVLRALFATRHLAITEQRAGQIVEVMVRDKFVSRQPSHDDARARILNLGPRGQALLKHARKFHSAYERRLTRELGAPVEATRAVLEHIVASSSDETAQGRHSAT